MTQNSDGVPVGAANIKELIHDYKFYGLNGAHLADRASTELDDLLAHIAAEHERMREVVERCAKVAEALADAENLTLLHCETPSDRGRCAVIAAEFRRAAKAIRAQETGR